MLPSELIELIITKLNPLTTLEFQTLLSCALVSRSWLAPSRRTAFEHLSICCFSRNDDDNNSLLTGEGIDSITPNVRSLELYGGEDADNVLATINKVHKRLEAIRVFRLTYSQLKTSSPPLLQFIQGGLSSLAQTISTSFVHLTEFWLTEVRFSTPDQLFFILSSVSTIQRLVLNTYILSGIPFTKDVEWSLPKHLRSLELRRKGDCQSTFIRCFLENNESGLVPPPRVETLVLSGWMGNSIEIPRLIQLLGGSLTTLDIQDVEPEYSERVLRSLILDDTSSSSMSSLSSLQALSISIIHTESAFPHLPSLLSLLPSSLSSLSIQLSGPEPSPQHWNSLDQLLTNTKRFPEFKRLELWSSSFYYDKIEEGLLGCLKRGILNVR